MQSAIGRLPGRAPAAQPTRAGRLADRVVGHQPSDSLAPVGVNELHGRRQSHLSPAGGRVLGQVAQVLDGRLAASRPDAADRDRPAAMRHREGVVGLGESV